MDEDYLIPKSRTHFATGFFNQVDHYKKVVFRYWWLPLVAAALGVGIQSNLLKRVPPAFVSAGRMIVNVKVAIPDANFYSEDVNNFLGTQVELMQSDSVKYRVRYRLQTNQPDIHPAPVDISVSVSPKSSIFNLQATGEDARYTQAFLQATMDEYISLKKDLLANASTATQSSMEEKLKEMGVELQKSKQEVLNYQASNNVVFLQPTGGNNAADYLSILTKQLDDHKSELQLLNSLDLDQNLEHLEQLQGAASKADLVAQQSTNIQPGSATNQASVLKTNSTNASTTNTILPGREVPGNLGDMEQAYLQTSRQYKALLVTRKMLLATVGTNALELPALNKEIAGKEIDLEAYREQSQAQLKNRQHILEVQIKVLEDQVQAKQAEAVDVNKKLAAFEMLKENAKRLQARYDQLQESLQTLDVDKGIGQESVTVLEQATTAVPVPPQRAKHLLMAGFFGLVLGAGLVVLIDRLDDRPSNFADMEKLFDTPVVGQFPLLKFKKKLARTPILQVNDDRHILVEASNSLRSAVLYSDLFEELHKERARKIVITSARPHDGKSTVSANFAITLAQTGSRVLLIDADLRHGSLHKHFTSGMSPGLSEVLAGKCNWSEAVVQTHVPNLHLIPCGKSPRNPGALFASAGSFLSDINEHYDYCLFDTAPLLVGDDVLCLAPQVDGLLMVIRAGFTSGRIAQAALEALRVRGVNVMGLVFNAVDPRGSDYFYYRYKEYYSERPKD